MSTHGFLRDAGFQLHAFNHRFEHIRKKRCTVDTGARLLISWQPGNALRFHLLSDR